MGAACDGPPECEEKLPTNVAHVLLERRNIARTQDKGLFGVSPIGTYSEGTITS